MPTIYKQRVEAGPLVFNVPGSELAGVLSWGVDVMDGWKDTSSPDVISTDLGNLNDGVELGDWFPARARFIVLGGWVYCASEAEAEQVHTQIVRDGFPRNAEVDLVRYESTARYARVRRADKFETDWSAVQNGFRWQTTVIARDPLLYSRDAIEESAGVAGQSSGGFTFPLTFPFVFGGASASVADTVSVFNRGSATSPSLIATLTGPLLQGGWRLRNDTTDQEIAFNTAVGVGEELVIDMRNQLATLNGFALTAGYEGEFLSLAPGSNDIRLYADFDPSAGVTILAESAWE